MGQPKAKWKKQESGWAADVGSYHLHADNGDDGRAEIYDADWRGLWEQQFTAPFDITDLMRACEAELERRLRGAADTMDGRELVAVEPEQAPREKRDFEREPLAWYVHERNGDMKPLTLVPGPGYASTHARCSTLLPSEHADLESEERAVNAALAQLAAEFTAKYPRCTVCDTLPTVYTTEQPGIGAVAYTCGHSPAERLVASSTICDFEDCEARAPNHRGSMSYCDVHAREHDENAKLWPGDAPELPDDGDEFKARPPVGSREWAIEQMRAGRVCVDVDGDKWRFDREGEAYWLGGPHSPGRLWGKELPDYACLDTGWRLQ